MLQELVRGSRWAEGNLLGGTWLALLYLNHDFNESISRVGNRELPVLAARLNDKRFIKTVCTDRGSVRGILRDIDAGGWLYRDIVYKQNCIGLKGNMSPTIRIEETSHRFP